MKKPWAGIALLLAAVLTLTACGNDPAEEPAAKGGAGFNDADVSFAQNMVPHHEQAVQMAQLAADSAKSAEVKKLAVGVQAALAPDIEEMTAWLEEWGEEVPSGSMDHGDMAQGDAPGTPGTTKDRERMFLTWMIEHHKGAVEMARTEQANGENDEALALAEKVEAEQAEIATLTALLEP